MLTPLDNTIRGVMELAWPMVIICVLIILSLRITYIITKKEDFVFYKEIFNLVFIIYIMCLFQIVTIQDDSLIYGDTYYNLIPFKEILRYHIGSRLFFKNVIGNLVMFVPYGFFASYLLKNKKPVIGIFLVLFASVSIEFTQLCIGRIFDIDDVLLNVTGGTIGFFLYYFLQRMIETYPKVLYKRWLLNMLSILNLILFIIYIVVVIL